MLERDVLREILKEDNDVQDSTRWGSVFHILGAWQQNARSPTVRSLVLGTTRNSLSADLNKQRR